MLVGYVRVRHSTGSPSSQISVHKEFDDGGGVEEGQRASASARASWTPSRSTGQTVDTVRSSRSRTSDPTRPPVAPPMGTQARRTSSSGAAQSLRGCGGPWPAARRRRPRPIRPWDRPRASGSFDPRPVRS